MAETGIMTGICTSPYSSPYPIEKVGESPDIPIPSQCENSLSKWGRTRTIPTETSLFAISKSNYRCRE